MTQDEFIRRIKGAPWVNRESSFDAVDCWGLVILYYSHVLDIDLPTVKGFIEKQAFETCYDSSLHLWSKVDNPTTEGIVFTCYQGDIPNHVGLCIGKGKALHSRGVNGKVEIHSLRAIERVCGKMTFHKFIG